MDTIPTRDQIPQMSGLAGPPMPGGRGPIGPAAPPPAITGRDILRIVRKRIWMILVTWLVVLVIMLGLTLLWWLYAPYYTAAARLTVAPPKSSELAAEVRLYSGDIMKPLVETHAQLVLSHPVLTRAAEQAKLKDTDWYRKNPTKVLERLADDLRVGPVGNTNSIQISLTARAVNDDQRTDLADIVNAVAEQFVAFSKGSIQEDRKQDIDNLTQARDLLDSRRENIRRQIAVSTEKRENLQEQRNILAVKMRTLASELVPVQLYLAQAQAAQKAFQQQVAEGTVELIPEVTAALEADGTLVSLRNMLVNLEAEQQRLATRFGPNHQATKTVKSRLASIKTQIAQREEMLTKQAVSMIASQRDSAVEAAVARIEALRAELQASNARDRDLQIAMTRIDQLMTNEINITKEMERIDKRVNELRLQATGEEQVTLTIRAIPPTEVTMPKWKIMVPLAIMLGLVAGFGLALVIEFVDTSIRGPSDIARRVNVPVLGIVPHGDDIEEEVEDLRVAFLKHPGSLIGEAFRQIRTCLMFSGPASQRRSLLVTSAVPEDGRTTVALNLAASIANGGHKTLVVDANFRHPAVRELFPDCPAGGLSSALVGQANWPDLVHEVQPNLYVMPAGMLPPNPAELLGSDQMRKILAEMVEQYEQVVIDGAPCLVVSDSPVLSNLVDAVILTVRADVNTHGVVQRARDLLQRVGGHIVGAVLNGMRATAGGYLRQNYETFYEYHEPVQTSV